MNYLRFILKRKLLQVKAAFFTSSKIGSHDSYSYKWSRLRALASKFNSKVLIETGTYYGITIGEMLPYFDSIYSIEVDEKLYHYNSIFYKRDNRVNLLSGDSKHVLPQVMSNIGKELIKFPVIFWLDGHYSGNETGMGEEYSPISSEIKSIASQAEIKSIVVIDDVRLFDGIDYPSLDQIISMLPQDRFRVVLDRDALVLVDSSL